MLACLKHMSSAGQVYRRSAALQAFMHCTVCSSKCQIYLSLCRAARAGLPAGLQHAEPAHPPQEPELPAPGLQLQPEAGEDADDQGAQEEPLRQRVPPVPRDPAPDQAGRGRQRAGGRPPVPASTCSHVSAARGLRKRKAAGVRGGCAAVLRDGRQRACLAAVRAGPCTATVLSLVLLQQSATPGALRGSSAWAMWTRSSWRTGCSTPSRTSGS